MNSLLKIVLLLCVIWGIAAAVIHFAHASKPTAQSIAAFLQKSDIPSKTGSAREKAIAQVEGMLNRVSQEERQQLRKQGITDGLFRSLTPEEQAAFLDATLPAGFKQMMESFNKMPAAKRKEFVDRALTEMRKHEGEQPPRNLDNQNVQKIVDQGMRSFYSDANAEVKLDLAPLIEQMQRNLQGPR